MIDLRLPFNVEPEGATTVLVAGIGFDFNWGEGVGITGFSGMGSLTDLGVSVTTFFRLPLVKP